MNNQTASGDTAALLYSLSEKGREGVGRGRGRGGREGGREGGEGEGGRKGGREGEGGCTCQPR